MFVALAVATTIVAGLLQAGLQPDSLPLAVRPSLVLILVVCWGTVAGVRQGLSSALAGGLMIDLFSTAPLGLSAIPLAAAAVLTLIGEVQLDRGHLVYPTAVVFIATIVQGIMTLAALYASGGAVDWLYAVRSLLLPEIILNMLVTPIVFLPIHAFVHRLRMSHRLVW